MTDADMTALPPVPPVPPTNAPTGPSAKTPRGIKIALAVSVALNLAVAGTVAGLALHDGPGGRGDRFVRDMGFGPFDAAFSPEDRAALRQSVFASMGDFQQMRQQMQRNMASIVTALRADPYNPSALTSAFDAQAKQLSDRLSQGNLLVRDYLLAFPAEARREFADRLERALRHEPGHDGRKPDDKPPGD